MARAHIRSGLVACLLLMFPGGSRAEVWTQDTYRNTLHYRTTFAADSSASGLLHIAAVDSFAVYFNGVFIGSNSSWNQVRTYLVDVLSGDNALAVEVVNRGLGVGAWSAGCDRGRFPALRRDRPQSPDLVLDRSPARHGLASGQHRGAAGLAGGPSRQRQSRPDRGLARPGPRI